MAASSVLVRRALNVIGLVVVALVGLAGAAGGALVALFSRSDSRAEVGAIAVPLVAVVVIAGGLCVAGLVLANRPAGKVASVVAPALAMVVLATPYLFLRGAAHDASEREADELAALNRPADDFAALGRPCTPLPDELAMQGNCPERYLCALDADAGRRCRSSCTFDRHCPSQAKCVAGLCR